MRNDEEKHEKTMSKLTDEQMAKGRALFLAANPQIKDEIEALTQEEADFMFTSLENLQKQKTMEALRRVARAKDIDPLELFLSHIADTSTEFAQMCEAHKNGIIVIRGLT